MKSQEIWILGAGRHGRRAAGSLRQEYPETTIAVVDSCAEACARMQTLFLTVICREGVDYLAENLQEGRGPDWILPMIPVHVAYEWIRLKLSRTHRLKGAAVPARVAAMLPNPVKGSDGQIYMSIADLRCPLNCPEPDDICTCTGKPRPMVLHQFLEKIRQHGFRSVVLHSRQLLPGIGGYAPADLFQALAAIAAGDGRVLLSTACRCHGVMHAFEIRAL